MLKLKRIKAGEYTTLDGKFLIRKIFMLNLWFAVDIKTLESVVNCEKSLKKIRESLEIYLMSTVTTYNCKVDTENSTESEKSETTEVELETAEATEKATEEALDMLINGITETTKTAKTVKLSEEKNPDLSNFHKALIKTLGMSRVKEVRYTVQGVNVFFEIKGVMYKCYTPQSKLYKLKGSCFYLITWRDLKKESDETDDNSGDIYTARPPP